MYDITSRGLWGGGGGGGGGELHEICIATSNGFFTELPLPLHGILLCKRMSLIFMMMMQQNFAVYSR